jgi:hypothetical protein
MQRGWRDEAATLWPAPLVANLRQRTAGYSDYAVAGGSGYATLREYGRTSPRNILIARGGAGIVASQFARM